MIPLNDKGASGGVREPGAGGSGAYNGAMREMDLLQRIYAGNAGLPPGVTIRPGDDMGAVRIGGGEVLVTVDQVADGLHFRLGQTPIEKIGRKAMTRNLSDVAAMGALPVGAVAAACLPRDFGAERAEALFEAMRRTGAAYNCPLFGGDISIWDHPLVITVTVLAEEAGVKPVLRRGAKVGDIVCVTGELGGSEEMIAGRAHHLDFEPRIKVARALASDPRQRPNAMIDLSDGLGRDLGHICEMSGVAAEVEVAALPVSPAAQSRAERTRKQVWEHAVGDGEDYELCFTLSREAAERLPRLLEGATITRIGRIIAGETGVTLVLPDGSRRSASGLGWEHRGP